MTDQQQAEKNNRWLTVSVGVLFLCNVFQFMHNNLKPAHRIDETSTTSMLQKRRLQSNDDINSVSMMPKNTVPGWNPIYVYFGETNKLDDKGKKFHGQLLQDEMVIKILNYKRNGYFIDLAANDAVGLSNTLALEQHYDWTGLCIEPNPEYWYDLAFRKCQTVGAFVGKNDDEEFSVVFAKKHLAGIEFKGTKRRDSVQRRTASLKRVFELFNVPSEIDYLSLDVEGAEQFVMEAFPFDKYRFSLLTIEWIPDGLKKILMMNGYKLVHHFRDWETLWVHESLDHMKLIRDHKLTRTWTGKTTKHVSRVSMPDP